MLNHKLPPPIHWHEGLLLQPHHLQQLVRVTNESLTYKTRLLSPFHWGVYRLEIDEDALAGGRFVVTELEAMLEDGLVLQRDLLAVPQLDRDLQPFQKTLEDGQKLTVYLGVPSPQERTVEVDEGAASSYPLRFRVHADFQVDDETSGNNPVSMNVLKAKAKLFIGEEDRSSYESFPLARIIHSGGAVRLDSYIPPTTVVTRTSPIAEMTRELCEAMRDRLAKLAGQFDAAARHQRRDYTLENRSKATVLAGNVLTLEQMIESEACRPLDFYFAYVRALGEVQPMLGQEMVPPKKAPRYDHLEIRDTLEYFRRGILAAIKSGPDVYERIEIEQDKSREGRFRTKQGGLLEEHLERPMYLVAYAGVGGETTDVHKWVEKHCVVTDLDHVRHCLDFKLTGSTRELQDPPPLDLIVDRGALVYRLKISKEHLETLRNNKTLFMVSFQDLPGDVKVPKTLQLFVRKPTEA